MGNCLQGESMNKEELGTDLDPSNRINHQIAELADWRGRLLARLRQLILETDSELTEEWKWETPVWTYKGMVCSAAAFKDHVKLNFFKGASLPDPSGLFNAGLDAKAMRAIDFSEGDSLNEPALIDLVRAAVAFNLTAGAKK
jgi:hypothetical protein